MDPVKLLQAEQAKKKSSCFKIFTCGGFCCSKDASKNEKQSEANLSKPDKMLPVKKNDLKAGSKQNENGITIG
jgi:hypothetical protein